MILKAPDHPQVAEAVDRLAAAGIPVVTLVTDVPFSRRLAYVGIDNRAAGRHRGVPDDPAGAATDPAACWSP